MSSSSEQRQSLEDEIKRLRLENTHPVSYTHLDVYKRQLFNLGAALLRRNLFEEAQQKLQGVVDHSPDDAEADALLAAAEDKKITPPNSKPLAPARLKMSMDSTAFRQLKAMLQPKTK